MRRPEGSVRADPTTIITWTGIASGVTAAPTPDTIVNVLEAQHITIQTDTTAAAHNAVNTRVDVFASLDGVAWDTIPVATRTLADNEIRSDWGITPGMRHLRFRITNLTTPPTVSDATVTIRVLIRR